MPESQRLFLFVGASLALLVTPGPAVLYIITRSIAQGAKAGVVSSLGLITGGIILVGLGAAGLTAVLQAYPFAMTVLRLAGAGYLVYLGVTQLRSVPANSMETVRGGNQPMPAVFKQAVVVNLLNPKAALFTFAFLPQFIDPGTDDYTRQFLALGGVFFVLAFITDSIYAFSAGMIGGSIRGSGRMAKIQPRITAAVYLSLGVAAVVGGW